VNRHVERRARRVTVSTLRIEGVPIVDSPGHRRRQTVLVADVPLQLDQSPERVDVSDLSGNIDNWINNVDIFHC